MCHHKGSLCTDQTRMVEEMDSELSERMVLGIVTNLNTRFVVLPLRSETIGDIRGTIRSYHMDLFPKWGEVDVSALEVELFGGRSRVADPLPIGHLFWKASQAAVFVELIPSSSSTLSELPRLKVACATELNTVPEQNMQQNSDGKLTPFPPETVGLVEGASTYSNHEKSVSDHGNDGVRLGNDIEAMGIQSRKKKRKIDERENVNVVRDMPAAADCAAAEIVEPVTKKCGISRDHPGLEQQDPETVTFESSANDSIRERLLVLESRLKASNTDGPFNCQESYPPVAEKEQEEAALLTSNPTEGGVEVESELGAAVGHESNERNGSRSSIQSGHPAAEKLQEESGLGSLHPPEDSGAKTLIALESKPTSSSNDLSGSGGQVGLPGIEKVEEEPVLVTSKPEDIDVGRTLTVADASAGSSSSDSSSESEAQTGSPQKKITRKNEADNVEVIGLATPEKKVPSGSVQNLNAISKRGSLEAQNRSKHSIRHENNLSSGTTSGGSTGEGVRQSKNSRDRSVDLQGKHHSSRSDGNESGPDEGSVSGRPTESSAGNDSDQNSSDGLSTPPSRDSEDSEDLESSSDESDGSEEVAPREVVKDVSTPKVGNGATRSVGRRSSGAIVDHKYQHLLDSQDGFDELISLSQQKLKVIPSSQQELQSVAGLDDTIAPVPLADDSLFIDVVLDTQASAKDLTAVERAENRSKERKRPMKEIVARNRLGMHVSMVPVEPIQDKVEDCENVQCTSGPSSAVKIRKTDLHLSVTEELMLSGGGTTENVPEPGVESPKLRSDDSQQIRAAVQLARMSTPTKAVHAVRGASPSKKRMTRGKGSSSVEDRGLINVQESTVPGLTEGQSKKCPEQEQGQNTIRDELVISLHEVDDQALEASRLLAPNENIGAGENLGKVLLSLEVEEATIKAGSTTAEEVASEADGGKKKHWKRRYKPLQESEEEEPPEGRRGQTNRLEDYPSRGSRDLPDDTSDEPGNKEHSGKNSSFEYRDLRKKSSLTKSNTPVLRRKLSLKRVKGLKSLNTESSKGAAVKPAEVKRGVTNEPARPAPGNSPPHVSILKKKGTDHEGTGVVGDEDSPSELIQRTLVEIDPSNSRLGKKKTKKEKKEGNKGELHVELNLKDLEKEVGKGQLEDTEDGNRGSEEPSDLLPRRESKDGEKGEERLSAFGSQESAGVQLNDESARKKKPERRRLSFEFSENLSSLKTSNTGEDRDLRQDLNTEPSNFPSQEVDFVSDRSLRQDLATKVGDLEGNEKYRNISTDNEVDTESPIVLGEKKIVRKSGRTQKTGQTVESAEAHVSLVSQNKAGEEHFTEDVPSSLGEKMKKKWDKLKKPKKQSKPDVAEDMEQLDEPTKGEDAITITRIEGNRRELSLKKKKKKKDLNLEPAVEVGNSNEDDGAPQLDLVGHEDQLAAPESPEIVKKQNLKTLPNNSRKRKLDAEESSQKEDEMQKRKVLRSRISELSPSEKIAGLAKIEQIKPASGKKRVNSNKRREGDTKTKESTKSLKRNETDRFEFNGFSSQEAVLCPHGCGKRWSKKTSAFFRHQKSCVLAHVPLGHK